MKNRLLLPVIVLNVFLFSSLSLNAQEYGNDLLKNYFLPDITRKSLDFELNSDGKYNKYATKEYGDSETMDLNGQFESVFNHYQNTRKFIGTQKVYLNLTGDLDKKSNESKTSMFRIYLGYENSSKFYFNKLFIETGGKALLSNIKRNQPDYGSRTTSIEGSIPILVGTGRIENVTDMRQAIYIVSSLSKQGILKQHISNEKMMEFAQVISTVKNKRFLDYRKHLKREIATVNSYLVDNGYITDLSSDYFTTLYDYWLYGGLFERKSGLEFKGGLQPHGYYDFNRHTYDSKSTNIGLNALLNIEYENPLNLYWQNSASLNLTGGISKYKSKYDDDKEDEQKQKSWALGGSYFWGYYPSSRTNINIGIIEEYSWARIKQDDYDTFYRKTLSSMLRLNFYYYISPQVRLKAEGNIRHENYFSSTSKYRWNGEYIFTLTYSLF